MDQRLKTIHSNFCKGSFEKNLWISCKNEFAMSQIDNFGYHNRMHQNKNEFVIRYKFRWKIKIITFKFLQRSFWERIKKNLLIWSRDRFEMSQNDSLVLGEITEVSTSTLEKANIYAFFGRFVDGDGVMVMVMVWWWPSNDIWGKKNDIKYQKTHQFKSEHISKVWNPI